MNHTTQSLIEELQKYPDIPVYQWCDHGQTPESTWSVRLCWAVTSTLDSYELEYGDELDQVMADTGLPESDFTQIVMIG
jgi:hypothetical protein